jgi:hypothetical protein
VSRHPGAIPFQTDRDRVFPQQSRPLQSSTRNNTVGNVRRRFLQQLPAYWANFEF